MDTLGNLGQLPMQFYKEKHSFLETGFQKPALAAAKAIFTS
jgi:hypothetical protein